MLDQSLQPLEDVWSFWKDAPYIPYNNKIDPYYSFGWPNPWEIIVENKYDDFTKALMISWTLKLTKKYQNSAIEIRSYIDSSRKSTYNVVIIDNQWAINFDDQGPVGIDAIPNSFTLENLIEVSSPR